MCDGIGEVFVLDDGGEVDLDLGNYERFLDVILRRDNNITTGKIYKHIIEKERSGDYLGKTVQGTVVQDLMQTLSQCRANGLVQGFIQRIGEGGISPPKQKFPPPLPPPLPPQDGLPSFSLKCLIVNLI